MSKVKNIFILVSILFLIFSCVLSPTNNKNQSPTINSIAANPNKLFGKDTSYIKCIATDPEQDELTYNWESKFGTIESFGDSAFWYSPYEHGMYYISCRVEDSNGNFAIDSVVIFNKYYNSLILPLMMPDRKYPFDVNEDGIEDLALYTESIEGHSSVSTHSISIKTKNHTMLVVDTTGHAIPFEEGFEVNKELSESYIWMEKSETLTYVYCADTTIYSGSWINIEEKYLPFMLSIGDQNYFGWFRMSSDTITTSGYPYGKFIIHEFYYNPNPGESIKTGDKIIYSNS